MPNSKVVNLGQVRDLAAEWEKVRQAIRGARVSGFYLAVMSPNGDETIYSGGLYKQAPEAAAKAALRISAVRVLNEDDEESIIHKDFQATR
jgi:expansin (peptidoglycan-binding protein)